jgi:hypothetical protein
VPAGALALPIGYPREKSHALTAAKMPAMISQVLVCGREIPSPRGKRISAAARNATASAARMYLAATVPHVKDAGAHPWEATLWHEARGMERIWSMLVLPGDSRL